MLLLAEAADAASMENHKGKQGAALARAHGNFYFHVSYPKNRIL